MSSQLKVYFKLLILLGLLKQVFGINSRKEYRSFRREFQISPQRLIFEHILITSSDDGATICKNPLEVAPPMPHKNVYA